MTEYYSRHVQNIDESGRIVLPGKLRRAAEEESGGNGKKKLKFFMKYLDGGLSLFTEAAWRPIRQHYLSYSNMDKEERKKKRKFFLGVEEVLCDRQGRMNISGHSRKKAKLKNKVVIVGVGDHIEIWNEESLRKVEAEEDSDDKKDDS